MTRLESVAVIWIVPLMLMAGAQCDRRRTEPILIDEPDAPTHLADYQRCVTIKPAPLRPPNPLDPYQRKDDVA